MVKFNWPTQKGTDLSPGIPVNPPVVTVEIVPSGNGDQADFVAAQQILSEQAGRINWFVQAQRQGHSLSTTPLAANRNTHPDLDVIYGNRHGAERIHLRVYPQPPGGGEQEILTLASPCLMILYGDDQIAAIPMSQLKNPAKLGVVHRHKIKASLGKDPLMTAQYKFGAAKSPSVVFCPINVDTKRALTTTDTYYLSAVGGHNAVASGPDAAIVQAELDSAGGRAFVAPIKTSLPRVGHSTAGVQYDKPNPRIPTINGSTDGATIYTPLDVYALDAKGKFKRTSGGGDANSLPYTIGQDGTYYYWPQWGPAHPQTSVMLNLGYAYFEPNNTSRNLSLGQTSLVPIPDAPNSPGSPATSDFTYDTPANLVDSYTGAFVPGPLSAKLIDLGKSTATQTTLSGTGYINDFQRFQFVDGGPVYTIGAVSTSPINVRNPAHPVTSIVLATDLLGFGYYSSSQGGGVAQYAGLAAARFGYAILAEDGTVGSVAGGESDFSGSVRYPFYTAPSPSGSKKDTLSVTLTPVTASDGDHLQLVTSFEGPDGTRSPTPPMPDLSLGLAYNLVLPRDGFLLGVPDSLYNGAISGVGSGENTGKFDLGFVAGPDIVFGVSISPTDLYTKLTRQVNDTKLVYGAQSIQFLGGSVSGSSDNSKQKQANFLYLEPFPPSLSANKAYYSIEQGDIAAYPGPGTDVPLANSQLLITTPYGAFAGAKFQPWLHVSNGQHYIQGFQIDDQSHLYCDGTDITATLPKALTGKGATVAVNDIKTVIMDVPLGVIKKLR
jgi:hypothetical protein